MLASRLSTAGCTGSTSPLCQWNGSTSHLLHHFTAVLQAQPSLVGKDTRASMPSPFLKNISQHPHTGSLQLELRTEHVTITDLSGTDQAAISNDLYCGTVAGLRFISGNWVMISEKTTQQWTPGGHRAPISYSLKTGKLGSPSKSTRKVSLEPIKKIWLSLKITDVFSFWLIFHFIVTLSAKLLQTLA